MLLKTSMPSRQQLTAKPKEKGMTAPEKKKQDRGQANRKQSELKRNSQRQGSRPGRDRAQEIMMTGDDEDQINFSSFPPAATRTVCGC